MLFACVTIIFDNLESEKNIAAKACHPAVDSLNHVSFALLQYIISRDSKLSTYEASKSAESSCPTGD